MKIPDRVVYVQELFNEIELINEYKNRGKIDIIDETLEGVPLVKFPGIPIDECLTIHDLAKKVLAISKNENNNNEVAITYSLDHERLKEQNEPYMTIVKGDETSTNVLGDTRTFHLLMATQNVVIVNLHNHPSGSDFSVDDITFFIKTESVKLMVLLPNDGGLFYLLKKDNYSKYNNLLAFAESVSEIKPEAFTDGKMDFSKLSYDEAVQVAKNYVIKSSALGVDYRFVRCEKTIQNKKEDSAKDIKEPVDDMEGNYE